MRECRRPTAAAARAGSTGFVSPRPVGPLLEQVLAREAEQHQRRVADAARAGARSGRAAGLGPVDVLEHQHQRAARRASASNSPRTARGEVLARRRASASPAACSTRSAITSARGSRAAPLSSAARGSPPAGDWRTISPSGPERDALPVGKAAPDQHRRAARHRGLAAPRASRDLPMPAGAEHDHALRRSIVGDALERLEQRAQLRVAAEQRASAPCRRCAPRVTSRRQAGTARPCRAPSAAPAARPRRVRAPAGACASPIRVSPGGGRLLEPGRHVDRVAGDERLAAAASPATTSPLLTPVRIAICTPHSRCEIAVEPRSAPAAAPARRARPAARGPRARPGRRRRPSPRRR